MPEGYRGIVLGSRIDLAALADGQGVEVILRSISPTKRRGEGSGRWPVRWPMLPKEAFDELDEIVREWKNSEGCGTAESIDERRSAEWPGLRSATTPAIRVRTS